MNALKTEKKNYIRLHFVERERKLYNGEKKAL